MFDLLTARGFNRYRYNGAGSGCLTWTTELVRLLEGEGILPVGSREGFLEKVAEVRADPDYWVPKEDGARFFSTALRKMIAKIAHFHCCLVTVLHNCK